MGGNFNPSTGKNTNSLKRSWQWLGGFVSDLFRRKNPGIIMIFCAVAILAYVLRLVRVYGNENETWLFGLPHPATALLWAMACLAGGGIVGFLFGIPKVIQDEKAGLAGSSQIRYLVNTNLEQISDWLTKIIVGLGLVNLRNFPQYLDSLAVRCAASVFTTHREFIASMGAGSIAAANALSNAAPASPVMKTAAIVSNIAKAAPASRGALENAASTSPAAKIADGAIPMFHPMDIECSIDCQSFGFAYALIVFFVIFGFIAGYLLTRLYLQRLLRAVDGADEARGTVIAGSTPLSQIDPDESLRPLADFPPEVRDAVRERINDPEAGTSMNVDNLLADAKAFYMAEMPDKAIDILRRAIALNHRNSDPLFYLCHILLRPDRHKEAEVVPLLETLVGMKGVRIVAWKLLGYALLWVPQRLHESAEASEKYLSLVPGDVGAMVNLACANGQLHQQAVSNDDVESAEKYRNAAIALVAKIVLLDPQRKTRLAELAENGEDLASLKDVKEFRDLISDPSKSPKTHPQGAGLQNSDKTQADPADESSIHPTSPPVGGAGEG